MAIQISNDIAQLPNLKRMFLADPGYTLIDADLSGADAQVVAWEADDDDLKIAFRSGVNVHMMNAEMMFGADWTNAPGHHKQLGTKKGRMYYDLKRGVHLTNYVGSARTLATVLGWTVAEAERFQSRWFSLHPGIREWHKRVLSDLRSTHTVTNKCGYHRTYFDRPDSCLSEAIAWIPQSTIAISCFRGADRIQTLLPEAEILLQVHDSLVFQIPTKLLSDNNIWKFIAAALQNPIPYSDPLTIQWKIAASGANWADVKEIPV